MSDLSYQYNYNSIDHFLEPSSSIVFSLCVGPRNRTGRVFKWSEMRYILEPFGEYPYGNFLFFCYLVVSLGFSTLVFPLMILSCLVPLAAFTAFCNNWADGNVLGSALLSYFKFILGFFVAAVVLKIADWYYVLVLLMERREKVLDGSFKSEGK